MSAQAVSSATDGAFIVPPCEQELGIVHADDRIIVVDKPSGLLSVPGRDPRNSDSVINRLLVDFPDARIVHRLDMDTSGLMVVARGAEVHRALSRQFQQREVEKRYAALVAGVVAADEGEIELPLITDWPNRPRQKVCRSTGKWALTRYRVVERDASSTRLALMPVTGRSHQLRVHCASMGHPILGDSLYAPQDVKRRSGRLMLHAAGLGIHLPGHAERSGFQVESPF